MALVAAPAGYGKTAILASWAAAIAVSSFSMFASLSDTGPSTRRR